MTVPWHPPGTGPDRLTYGALATPVTFLLFYYFISMSIIIGAQFNNALLESFPPLVRSMPTIQDAPRPGG